jgi:hypothetical protein
MPVVNTAPIAAVMPALLEDAARRSGVGVKDLRVLSVEAVTWPDGSLGCRQPGRLYPQVLVPGHRVRIALLTGNAPPLNYHLGARGGWVHCPPEHATPPLPPGADPRI